MSQRRMRLPILYRYYIVPASSVATFSLIVSDYLFDVRDKTILKYQGEYFIGGIQHRNTPVVVAAQPISLRVYGVDDAEIPITRHRFAIPHLSNNLMNLVF